MSSADIAAPSVATAASRGGKDRVWTVARWALAILVALIAILPVWWMVNVVFSNPGEPVSINPRLYPTSLEAGLSKVYMILTETEYLRAYVVSLLYALLTIAGVLLFGSMAAFEFALFDFPGKRIKRIEQRHHFNLMRHSDIAAPPAGIIAPGVEIAGKSVWRHVMRAIICVDLQLFEPEIMDRGGF